MAWVFSLGALHDFSSPCAAALTSSDVWLGENGLVTDILKAEVVWAEYTSLV